MIGWRRARSRADAGSTPAPGFGPLGPDPSEPELWAAAQQGATAAFGLLFDRHVDAVYRCAVVRLHDPQAAEEIVSIVFAEAWRQRHRIELLDGTLRPWLVGVARNQANRAVRQRVRQLRRDQALVVAAASDHAAAVAAGVDAASDLVRVLDAIDDLPAESRDTLVLHVWGELSHDQIAHEMGVSVGTVKSRLHRARQRLATVVGAPSPRALTDRPPTDRPPTDRRTDAAPAPAGGPGGG